MISIALCTYNGEKFLREQLDSIVNQTLIPNEIVISDDNSKDKTLEIVEEYKNKYPNISFVINKNVPGLGVYKNFEKAISLCTGDIIFCSDQDDVWKENKIEKTYKAFKKDTLLVFSNAAVVDRIPENYINALWNKKQISDRIKNPYRTFVYQGGSVAGCCMAFRKSFSKKIFPFPDKIYHDDWLITCASILGKIECVSEELMYYRQHGNNVVGIKRGSKLSYYKSLLLNTKPYIEHREYIYERNVRMFAALKEKKFVKNEKELDECLKLYEHRATIAKHKGSVTRKNCIKDNKDKFYKKYTNGFSDFIYDIYLSFNH